MGNAIDRLLLGGAFVFGGLIHRKVGHVDDRVGLVEDVVEDLALSPQVPGMPLPTGYGLQVKGPAVGGHPDPRLPAARASSSARWC